MYRGFGSELKVAQFMLWFLSNSVGSWWDLVWSLSSKTVWFDLHELHKGFVNWLGTVPSGDLSSLLICRRFQPQREVSPSHLVISSSSYAFFISLSLRELPDHNLNIYNPRLIFWEQPKADSQMEISCIIIKLLFFSQSQQLFLKAEIYFTRVCELLHKCLLHSQHCHKERCCKFSMNYYFCGQFQVSSYLQFQVNSCAQTFLGNQEIAKSFQWNETFAP